VYWSCVASPGLPSASWSIGDASLAARICGPSTIAYCPSVLWAGNVRRSVVLPLSQEEPVIAPFRSTPPGPTNDATSSASVKLAGSIALLNVISTADTAEV
jgi:hypothetical protein